MKDNTYNSKIIINSNYAAKHYYDESREYKKVLENLKSLQEVLVENNINRAEHEPTAYSTSSKNKTTFIDEVIKNCTDSLNEYNKILEIDKESLKEILESFASWILKNFSSPKLNPLLILFILLFNKLNHTVDIQRSDILKQIEVETYEEIKVNEKKEKFERDSSEIISKDCFITNPFMSALYALIVTIANKPEIIVKSRSLLKNVLTILTQICDIDNIAIYYKKKRLISVFIKILKELFKSPEAEESLLHITKLLSWLFSKIGLKRQIYKDYLFKKSVPEKITDVYMKFYSKDMELVRIFGIFVYFSCRITDHKVFFWTKGIVENFMTILRQIMDSHEKGTRIRSLEEDEKIIENLTFALNHLSLESAEVQGELVDQSFIEIYKRLLMKYSKNNFIICNIVSCIRRFRDGVYMDKIAEELLFTFFALFDYYYLSLKNQLENINSTFKNSSQNPQIIKSLKDEFNSKNKIELLNIKEIIGLFGNIVKNEVHQKPFVDKNIHLVFIDVLLSFIDYPKIVKNTIGTMINLTTNGHIRNDISKVAAFVNSIYLILEKYNDTPLVLDYELKLLINILKNDISSKIFSSGQLFVFLIFNLIKYPNHDMLMSNSLKILRALLLKKKTLDEFFEKMILFYTENIDLIPNISEKDKAEIRQSELMNSLTNLKLEDKKAKFLLRQHIVYKNFLDNLIEFLIKKYEDIDIAIEVLLFVSYLTNQDEKMKNILEQNEGFFKVLKKIVEMNSRDETVGKLISQCIAQLPIEEFNTYKYYSNFK